MKYLNKIKKNKYVKRINKFINKHKIVLLLILISIILLLNLFNKTRYYGHDTGFHISNITALSKTISIINPLGSNILEIGGNIFGYGTYLFYPKLPHLISAYLYLITEDIYLSMNIIYLLTMILSGIIVYKLSNKIFKAKNIALISSIIYLTIPYHICEIYVRDAFAENFMFLSFPLIILGLYNLKEKNDKNFYIPFILGYIIGMHSHLVSMVFYTIFIGIYIIINYKIYIKKEKLKPLIIATIIVTCISLPYLTKILEHKQLGIYTVFESDTFTSEYKVLESVVNIKSLVINEPYDDKIMVYLNYTTIILFALTTINLIINKKNKNKKEQKKLLIYIIVLITLITSKLIWKNIPEFLLMIQFVWRLLVPLSLLIAIYSPLCLLNINNKIIKKYMYLILIVIIIAEGLNNIKYYGNYEYNENEMINNQISLGWQREYLPLTCNKITFTNYYMNRNNEIKITDENIKIDIEESNFPNLKFEIKNLESITTIELPRIYYKGYKLTNKSGEKIKLNYSKEGFVEADIKSNGIYYLKYNKTILEKISSVICISTIISVVIYLLKRRSKLWKRKK